MSEHQPSGQPSAHGSPILETDTGYKAGASARHSKFGEGTHCDLEGSGEHSRLQVKAFQGRGSNGWWRPMRSWEQSNIQKNIIIL